MGVLKIRISILFFQVLEEKNYKENKIIIIIIKQVCFLCLFFAVAEVKCFFFKKK